MEEQKLFSLRDLFHILGNKHYSSLLAAGMANEALERVLNTEDMPSECKEMLTKAMERMGRIEKASKLADILLDEIRQKVYEKLNPDEIKVAAKVIDKRMEEPAQSKRVF